MRSIIVLGAAGLMLAGCVSGPHYRYPAPYEAPVAPVPHTSPPPAYQAPAAPQTVKPLGEGLLTAKNVETYMDGEERQLRADLKGSGAGVSRPGDAIVLYLRDDLLFAQGSTELTARGEEVIAAIAADAVRYDSTALEVNGYTDTRGTPDEQVKLSSAKAVAVAKALEADGVDIRRLSVQGLGATHLKIATANGIAEPRNRRVEIRIAPRMHA